MRTWLRSFLALVALGAATIAAVHFLARSSSPRLPLNASPANAVNASAGFPQLAPMSNAARSPVPISSSAARPTPAAENYQLALPDAPAALRDWRGYDPETLRLRGADGAEHRFIRTRSYVQNDRRVWVGRNEHEGEFFVGTGARDHWVGLLAQVGEDTQEFTVRDGRLTTRVIWQEDETCGLVEGDRLASSSEVPMPSPSALAASAAYTVDVAFFYDAGTLAASNGSVDQLRSTLLTRVEAMNQALAQSLISNFRWNLAGLFAIGDYTATEKMNDDLAIFSNTGGTVGKEALAKSESVGADQYVLLVSGSRDWAGLANLGGKYAVVNFPNTSYTTIAHEMAHNFGALHDRVTENAKDSDGKFNYGYTLDTVQIINGSPWTFRYGTIMSYFGNRVAYFSNPNVTYQGGALGKAITDPQAAYDAKTLEDAAASMANYRATPTQPSITRQPASASVTVGSVFSFSVNADGGGTLAYQWYFNDTAIAGANSSTYSKTAANSDQGSYTVKVTNIVGNVTSNAATLSVTTPPPPASNGGAGGGGGGGGAPSWHFLAMIVSALALRRARPRTTT